MHRSNNSRIISSVYLSPNLKPTADSCAASISFSMASAGLVSTFQYDPGHPCPVQHDHSLLLWLHPQHEQLSQPPWQWQHYPPMVSWMHRSSQMENPGGCSAWPFHNWVRGQGELPLACWMTLYMQKFQEYNELSDQRGGFQGGK